MQGFMVYLLLLCVAIFELNVVKCARITSLDSYTTFDVTEFGAIGDGITDDAKVYIFMLVFICSIVQYRMFNSRIKRLRLYYCLWFEQAFKSAWEAACNKGLATSMVTVPSGKTFLVSSVKFVGPCKSRSITFKVSYVQIFKVKMNCIYSFFIYKNRSLSQDLYHVVDIGNHCCTSKRILGKWGCWWVDNVSSSSSALCGGKWARCDWWPRCILVAQCKFLWSSFLRPLINILRFDNLGFKK